MAIARWKRHHVAVNIHRLSVLPTVLVCCVTAPDDAYLKAAEHHPAPAAPRLNDGAGPMTEHDVEEGRDDAHSGPFDTVGDRSGREVQTGSWDDPIRVSTFPFTLSDTTKTGPSAIANSYTPCAPDVDESGPEFVFELTFPTPYEPGSRLAIAVDDVPGDDVDVDIHVLSEPSPDACFARANVALSIPLADPPSPLWVTVDSWANSAGDILAGSFTVTFHIIAPSADDCITNPIPACEAPTMPVTNASMLQSAPSEAGCPPGTTRVESFCIDRWEAAVAIAGPGGSLEAWSPFAHPPNDATLVAISAPDLVPQGYINQVQAAQACEGAGKRLCTDEEWLRACRGPTETTYPYGDSEVEGHCNGTRDCHPVVQFFESGASWVWSELDHPCINQLPDGLAPTGSATDCVSAEGAYDMVGNLHEWTSSAEGTFRGGFYADTSINGPGCLYATTAHNVWHWDYSTGFRCCADPTPP